MLTLVAMYRAECRFLGADNEGDDWCASSSFLLARWDGMMGKVAVSQLPCGWQLPFLEPTGLASASILDLGEGTEGVLSLSLSLSAVALWSVSPS